MGWSVRLGFGLSLGKRFEVSNSSASNACPVLRSNAVQIKWFMTPY